MWQHIGCVKASTDVEHYHCERCSSREVDYEVPLDVPPPEVPSPNEKHYLTLMRDNLQIRQGILQSDEAIARSSIYKLLTNFIARAFPFTFR